MPACPVLPRPPFTSRRQNTAFDQIHLLPFQVFACRLLSYTHPKSSRRTFHHELLRTTSTYDSPTRNDALVSSVIMKLHYIGVRYLAPPITLHNVILTTSSAFRSSGTRALPRANWCARRSSALIRASRGTTMGYAMRSFLAVETQCFQRLPVQSEDCLLTRQRNS